jgi:NAD+ diphosphatase
MRHVEVPTGQLRNPSMRTGLDRRGEEREDNHLLLDALEDPGTRSLLLHGSQVAVVLDGHGEVTGLDLAGPPAEADVEHSDGPAFLARTALAEGGDEVAVVARTVPAATGELDDPGRHFRDLREMAGSLSDVERALALEAVGLLNFRRSHRFCPRCGSALATEGSGWVLRCDEHGHQVFPRTDPAVIMAVRDASDRLLLARNHAFHTPRMFSVLAGYVEPGETLEDAVARESAEETGVDVERVEYAGSQPWPFPASLMLGFRAWAPGAGDELELQDDEIAEARWFTRDRLRAAVASEEVVLPSAISIARALIEDWLADGTD